jgi:hypothetical protein
MPYSPISAVKSSCGGVSRKSVENIPLRYENAAGGMIIAGRERMMINTDSQRNPRVLFLVLTQR